MDRNAEVVLGTLQDTLKRLASCYLRGLIPLSDVTSFINPHMSTLSEASTSNRYALSLASR